MKKDYDNKELELILRYTFDNSYGELTPVVIDFFKRHAYEYNYSNEEIIRKATKFKKDVKSIDFVTEESGDIEEGEIGGYIFPEHRIAINRDYYEKLYSDLMDATDIKKARHSTINKGKAITKKEAEERFIEALYGTIIHECEHAVSKSKTIRGVKMGLIYYTLKGEKVKLGAAFGEAWNEAGSKRLLGTGREKNLLEPQITDSYEQLSFLPSFLATTCGLMDKEVIKAGLEGRPELYKILSKNYKSMNDVDVSIDIADIEKDLSCLFYYSNNTTKKGLSLISCQEHNSQYLDSIFHKTTMFLKKDMDELSKMKAEKRNKKTFEEYDFRIKRAEHISERTLVMFREANLVDDKQYNYEIKRIKDRTKGLKIYLQRLNLPHDPNNTYLKRIMEEDLDNGKTWEFPDEIRGVLLNQFEKPNFWQRFVKSTMRLNTEQNIQKLSNRENSLRKRTNNSEKRKNEDDGRVDW